LGFIAGDSTGVQLEAAALDRRGDEVARTRVALEDENVGPGELSTGLSDIVRIAEEAKPRP
jgi:hypothetical protein